MNERIGARHLIFPHPDADHVEYETVNGTECVAWFDAQHEEWIICFFWPVLKFMLTLVDKL